jgi:hypothetical protein
MALIKSGETWQFRTEADLEEVVWRNLPVLLNMTPFKRQFSVDGKFCDILAMESSNRPVVIELKNTEDRYIVQQLIRYYDAIRVSATFPLEAEVAQSIRLVAIAPSFHADTLIDCKYSTLNVELMTFRLESLAGEFSLLLSDVSGNLVSTLPLLQAQPDPPADSQIPAPPRKLLNWLSQSSEAEYDWVLQMRKQILGFDVRMKEIVTPTSIFYGRGKSKPCCELRKETKGGLKAPKVIYFLWLPHPENKPHVLRMMMNYFDLQEKKVRGMIYSRSSYMTSIPWRFPECIRQMKRFRYDKSLEQYQPFLEADMTISPSNIVNLALQTWHRRI